MARTRGGGTDRGGRRRVTQADVASQASVSAAIVSAVVNGREHGNIRISERTRARVWDAVRELGYVPNIAARNLARGSNRLIGVFTYQSLFPLARGDFYFEFLVGIEEEAERAGYNLLMFTGSKDATGARSIYADGVNCLQLADGAVLVGSDESPAEIARLADEAYPFVTVGRRDLPGVALSYAAADYAAGTAALVGELVARGHRRIAMVHYTSSHESLFDRRDGFRQAREEYRLAAADTPILTISPTGTPMAGSDGAVRDVGALLDQVASDGTTALVVEATDVAVDIRSAARRAGVAVPEQLAIVALGGAPEVPGAAGVSDLVVPRRDMGREAVRLLLRLLADPAAAPLRSTLPCGMKLGRTVGPAGRRGQA